MTNKEKREDPFTYEANAIVEGPESGESHFVHNRSETPEGAKSGLRSTARLQHPYGYKENEDLSLENVQVNKLDPENGYKHVERVE